MLLNEMAMMTPEVRRFRMDELRSSLAHVAVRKALLRLGPPKLDATGGLRVAILLQELRKEVEEWDSRG